ncbi:hypothetical protein FACS189449_09110 [Alphaproteobacteria bacterium]|nr:hypothetical protein FACS189449_09110 [Alphaproteobacteria bacterium]
MLAKTNEWVALNKLKAEEEACIKWYNLHCKLQEANAQSEEQKKTIAVEVKELWIKFDDLTTKRKHAEKELEGAKEQSKELREAEANIKNSKKHNEDAAKNFVAAKKSDRRKVVFHEVRKVSRRPEDSAEVAAADDLKSRLGLGDDYEIRYMDAKSIIGGMGFSASEKERFLNLLKAKNESEAIKCIENYLNNDCVFFDKDLKNDEGLKEEVSRNALKGCKESKACMDAFITLIARVEMPQPFFSTKIQRLTCEKSPTTQKEKLSFIRAENATSDCDNKIELNNRQLHLYSLDENPLKTLNLPNGLSLYPADIRYTLSHECGHSISGNFARWNSKDNTMDVYLSS